MSQVSQNINDIDQLTFITFSNSPTGKQIHTLSPVGPVPTAITRKHFFIKIV